MLFLRYPKFCISIVFSFAWGHFNSQEKVKTMPMQNFRVTNKEHYGMLWYFLEWSIEKKGPGGGGGGGVYGFHLLWLLQTFKTVPTQVYGLQQQKLLSLKNVLIREC